MNGDRFGKAASSTVRVDTPSSKPELTPSAAEVMSSMPNSDPPLPTIPAEPPKPKRIKVMRAMTDPDPVPEPVCLVLVRFKSSYPDVSSQVEVGSNASDQQGESLVTYVAVKGEIRV